jgi:hypothetical protein
LSKKSKKPDYGKTRWVELGVFPGFVGFVPDKDSWDKTVKNLGNPTESYPTTDGRCTQFVKGQETTILITVADGAEKNRSLSQVVGIIAHEATHAWQMIKDNIGERNPGHETEAYFIQCVTQTCFHAFYELRKLPKHV